MTVQSDDIKFFLTGGATNSNPSASLGGAMSSVEILNDINLLFSDIDAVSHSYSQVSTDQQFDYRVFSMKLSDPLTDSTNTPLTSATLKTTGNSLGDTNLEFFVAPTVNTTFTLGNTVNDAPKLNGTLTFSSIPMNGLDLPSSIVPGDEVHIAVRRSIAPGVTPGMPTSMTLQISGSTT